MSVLCVSPCVHVYVHAHAHTWGSVPGAGKCLVLNVER